MRVRLLFPVVSSLGVTLLAGKKYAYKVVSRWYPKFHYITQGGTVLKPSHCRVILGDTTRRMVAA